MKFLPIFSSKNGFLHVFNSITIVDQNKDQKTGPIVWVTSEKDQKSWSFSDLSM